MWSRSFWSIYHEFQLDCWSFLGVCVSHYWNLMVYCYYIGQNYLQGNDRDDSSLRSYLIEHHN